MTTHQRLLAAFEAAVNAVDPEGVTEAALTRRELPNTVRVVALGKGAPAMVRGAAAALGTSLVGGVAVSDHEEEVPKSVELLIGSHPTPDGRSVQGGRRLLEAAALDDVDLLIVLISGGGSALAEAPVEPLTIETIGVCSDALMTAGAPIGELNTVRRHLSNLKNGGLLRAARVPVLALAVSDVVGAPSSAIASGPTLADHSTRKDALSVFERFGVAPPPEVLAVLSRPVDSPAAPVEHQFEVVADGAEAARVAAGVLDGADILTTELTGDAVSSAHHWFDRAPRGYSVIAGETTVTVQGGGLGGRNQHAALAMAIDLEDTGHTFAAFGTDGRDGPTDAAGAIVDGSSAARLRSHGIDPGDALERCDSHPALDTAGLLIRTGPTGTNVGDLWLIHKVDGR